MLPSSTRARVDPPRPAVRSPHLAVALLGLVYLVVALLGDPAAGFGSDTGGKLATARVMSEQGTVDPDVGYWAEDLDPEGRFHPLVNTEPLGDGWVQSTSLLYSVVTSLLWTVAGPLGPALLSMAGALATALAARRLAQRLGGDPDLAFWLVGLASPVAAYAVDAWEHAPALGLASWAVVLALETASRRQAAAAGALLGAAVLLRAEVGATAVALAVAVAAVPSVRRRWTGHPSWLLAGALPAGALLLGNGLVERLVIGGGVREVRAGNGASAAGHDLGQRLTDVVLTGGGLFPDESSAGLLLAGVLVTALAVLAWSLRPGDRVPPLLAKAALLLVVGLYLLRVLDGWSFVPGALAVAPVAVLAVLVPRTDEVKVLLGTALGAIPLVWALQWRGNHVAQWGARYLLVSTVLLLVLAAVALSGPARRRPVARLLVGLTVAAGVAGMAWHGQRTDVVGAAGDALAALPADTVVVADRQHLGRELGAHYGEHRWLSSEGPGFGEALDLAVAAAPPHLAVVRRQPDGGTLPGLPALSGYERVDLTTVPYLGTDLEVQLLARR